MGFSFELKDEPTREWNNYLLKNTLGNIYNSKEYAEYARKWLGWKPNYCQIVDFQGNIVLQVLLLEYTSGIERIPPVLHGVIKRFKNTLRWNYGPVSTSQEALSFFFEYLKRNKKRIYGVTHPLSTLSYDYFTKTLWSTFLIDLTETKDELYNKLSVNNARKNVERSIERNVTVEEVTDKTVDEYCSILNSHRSSMKLELSNPEEMFDMWKLLQPLGFSGFIARKEGRAVGGLLFSFFNNYINEWGVARSLQDTEEKLYTQDLIKWKIIEWGIEHKLKWYDLSGVNPSPKSKKEEGILQYKKKWGGIQKDYWIISSP